MQTVQAIITKAGGWERLKKFPIQVINGEHMPLIIEYLGKIGFNGSDFFRVMQLETVDEKQVRETEISFECDSHGNNWQGVVWYSELTGEKRFAYVSYEINDGKKLTRIDTPILQLIEVRAEIWDEDIFALGYLDAAEADTQGMLFSSV